MAYISVFNYVVRLYGFAVAKGTNHNMIAAVHFPFDVDTLSKIQLNAKYLRLYFICSSNFVIVCASENVVHFDEILRMETII